MSSLKVEVEPLVCSNCKEANIPVMSMSCRHSYCRGCIHLRCREQQQQQQPSEGCLLSCPICKAKDAFDATDTQRHVNDKACALMETAVNLKIALSAKQENYAKAVVEWKKGYDEKVRVYKSKAELCRRQSEKLKEDLEKKEKEFDELKEEFNRLRKKLMQLESRPIKTITSPAPIPVPGPGQLSVGDRIAVLWKDHNRFYNATIDQHRPSRGRCLGLLYDDGDEEWVNPKREQIVLLQRRKQEDVSESNEDGAQKKKPSARPKRNQNKESGSKRKVHAVGTGSEENESDLDVDGRAAGARKHDDKDLSDMEESDEEMSDSSGDEGKRQGKRQKTSRSSVALKHSQEEGWNRKLEELKAFKEKHKNFQPPQGGALSNWVLKQRCCYLSANGYPTERVDKLAKIGFDWTEYSSIWDVMFAELCRFKERHGHVNIPVTSKKLFRWLTRQRKLFGGSVRNGSLSAERADRLKSLGVRLEQYDQQARGQGSR